MKMYPPRERTISQIVADKAQQNGQRSFLRFEDSTYSCESLHETSNRIANSVQALGIGAGTHVAIFMDNKPEVVLTYIALGKLGAVAIPINTASKGEMLAYFLQQSDAEYIVADAALVERLAAVIPQAPKLRRALIVEDGKAQIANDALRVLVPIVNFDDLLDGSPTTPEYRSAYHDPWMIMYTSGTTGRSKGVMVSQCSVLTQALAIAAAGGYSRHDVLYTCLPLFHANAWWCSVLPALLADAEVVLSRRFSASQFWNEVRRYGVTQFNLLGAMATFLWSQPEKLSDKDHRVRQALVVPVPEQFYHRFEARFNLKLKSLYGLTDAAISAIKRESDPAEKWRSAGRPCDYVELRIADDDDFELPRGETGEILLRSREPWAFANGYYNMPDTTAAAWRNLWLHTGDRGYVDADGYLYFVGRKKDSIRRRGENISAFEVEQIINGIDAVAEVAAFGVTSEHGEEDVMVSIVKRPELDVSAQDVIAYCQANMAYYMVPRFIEFVPDLPRNMTEKVEKHKLRSDAEMRLYEIWDRERAGIIVTR